jgi:WD40 repeat protein
VSIGLVQLFNSNSNTFGSNYTFGGSTVKIIVLTPDLVFVISAKTDKSITLWTWSTMSLIHVKAYTISTTLDTGGILASVYTGGWLKLFHLFTNLILIK